MNNNNNKIKSNCIYYLIKKLRIILLHKHLHQKCEQTQSESLNLKTYYRTIYPFVVKHVTCKINGIMQLLT